MNISYPDFLQLSPKPQLRSRSFSGSELLREVVERLSGSSTKCSSLTNGDSFPLPHFQEQTHSSFRLLPMMNLFKYINPALHSVFLGLISCHVCYLFMLRAVIIGRTKSSVRAYFPSDKEKALTAMSGLWAFAFGLPQALFASLVGLGTGLSADRACGIVLLILVTLYFIVETRLQRLRKGLKAKEDEEGQEPNALPPDVRSLPIICKDIGLEYARGLKHRFGRHLTEPKGKGERFSE